MGGEHIIVRDRLEPRREAELMQLFAEQWWTTERTAEDAMASVSGSSVVVAAVDEESDALVGFARVLTDGVYVALILDVMVADRWRGTGVGARLMDFLVAHPVLSTVESLELVCRPHLVGFYARWGFNDDVGTAGLMKRRRGDG